MPKAITQTLIFFFLTLAQEKPKRALTIEVSESAAPFFHPPNRNGKFGPKGLAQRARLCENILATMFNRACLTAGCQTVTVRESTTPAAGPGLHYRRFAVATLGVAVLVAFGASDYSAPDAQSGQVATAAVPAKAPAKRTPKLIRPATSWAMSDDTEADLAGSTSSADLGSAGQSPQAAPTPQAATEGKADRPSPEELGRLIASSRARSGGVDQGDEPIAPIS